VELDVLLSADGEIVVHHDYHLNPEIARTPDGAWLHGGVRPAVKALTLAELKTYDVGRLKPHTASFDRYPAQRPVDGERIPTLREVIAFYHHCGGKISRLCIEIKTSPEAPDVTPGPEAMVEAVVRLLALEGIADRAFIFSFDWRALKHAQTLSPDIPRVYLSHIGANFDNIKPGQAGPHLWTGGLDVADFGGSIPRMVKAAGGRYWGPDHEYLTSAVLHEAHGLGLKVFAWTPDDPGSMLRLIKMNVDGVITNRPDRLKCLLREFAASTDGVASPLSLNCSAGGER
ncbi:MAG: hypothetical protein JSW39_07170, partial [Desulfobacterales bacterium]